MADRRFRLIYNAAGALFIRQGYARTQIRDIVRRTGISTGALYSLFDSKRAILLFLLQSMLDPDFLDFEYPLPVTEAQFEGLEDRLTAAFDANLAWFGSHLEDAAADYPYPAMLSDAFDVISRYAVGCLFIENNPDDCGALWSYYLGYRWRFRDAFARYVALFVQRGELRPLDQPALHVRLMVETLSWWGMHLPYDAFEPDPVPASRAKAICLDALVHAYQA